MDFCFVFEYLLSEFEKENIKFALIGGFALEAYGVNRATQDIDFLVLIDNKDKVKSIMEKGEFNLLYESKDVLNYVGSKPSLGRVDFLIAQRKYAFEILNRAEEKEILNGRFKLRFAKVEDQIGLKVQSSTNDPSRYTQDLADIENLIKVNFEKLNISLIREYFSLFKRESELDIILTKYNVK